MEIKKGSVVTLNNSNKYLVISKVINENTPFLYLININDNSDIKFGYEKKEIDSLKIIEIKENNIIKNLIPLFDKDVKDSIKVE